jgi:formylglycine-generating enzyme
MRDRSGDRAFGASPVRVRANQGRVPIDEYSLSMSLACDSDRATWTDSVGANESLPINCVSWYLSMAFCIWDGGHLPTAAEWQYAAAGGNDNRPYPWSEPSTSVDIDCSRASFLDQAGRCYQPYLMDVGSTPGGDSRWGHADMAASVSEWVLDYYPGYLRPRYVDPCIDCADLVGDPDWPHRAIRGGDFESIADYLRVADWRSGMDPRNHQTGFRCARDP